MAPIDEDGNLFGVLNVVDVLVVVLLVGVVVGVAGLVAESTSDPGTDTVTRYVTFVDDDRTPGFTPSFAGGSATVRGVDGSITDVRHGTSGGAVTTSVRVRFRVPAEQPERIGRSEVVLAGRTVKPGTELLVESDDAVTRGTVVAVGPDAPRFDGVNATVSFEATVLSAVASAVEVGDRHRVGNDTIAVVDAVQRRDASEGTRLAVTATVRAWESSSGLRYGTHPLKPGVTLLFETDRYAIRGTVTEVAT